MKNDPMNDILQELRKPFHPSHVTWKPGAISKDQTKALALAYADLRAYQNRLDEVCGMDWSVTYTPWGERIVCHLTINGVTRSSSGEPDSQAERSEIAGTAAEAQAFKRACAMFGLGRYLYNLPSVWVEYDAEIKQFTDKARAKLENIIVQHYRRKAKEEEEKEVAQAKGEGSPSEPMATPPAVSELVPETPTANLNGTSTDNEGQEHEQAQHEQGIDEGLEPLRTQFNQLGQELYGEQWTQVRRHNVERITGGKAKETGALSAEQIQKLVEGMKKLQRKRHVVTTNTENGHAVAF